MALMNPIVPLSTFIAILAAISRSITELVVRMDGDGFHTGLPIGDPEFDELDGRQMGKFISMVQAVESLFLEFEEQTVDGIIFEAVAEELHLPHLRTIILKNWTMADGDLKKFLAKHGNAVHHLCLQVVDIESSSAGTEKKELKLMMGVIQELGTLDLKSLGLGDMTVNGGKSLSDEWMEALFERKSRPSSRTDERG
ncbi:hypothetical protein P152DRAFT_450874 [Eremomyces bilateralis CBS 781.70]|uniref:Uncharacterized protein n=1 Tax=Eremomyces bilateralis CBS 781.70 TaxID=1392243 RepID=A0A6G1FYN7_9PEZI|nr:uncharacterized protein P152DRAFT_450874 [Eremomyces bilateralis CBS 781.70]KAF1810894.1 hypothetical protein P152DRAFT_450874 [Eremomyces bilateralis CBS 781.70]